MNFKDHVRGVRNHSIKYLWMGVAATTLFACGGGNSNNDADNNLPPVDQTANTKTGKFLDSAVEGLRYVSGSLSGVTNAAGEFTYRDGNLVKFYVGDILLGEVAAKDVVTPMDLAATTSVTNDTVINLARFLQTIDDDRNPANGIKITDAVATLAKSKSIDFTLSAMDFENNSSVQAIVAELTAATMSGASALAPTGDAIAHLSETLVQVAGVPIDWNAYYAFENNKKWAYNILALDAVTVTRTMYKYVKTGSFNGQDVWVVGWSDNWAAGFYEYLTIDASGLSRWGWTDAGVDHIVDPPFVTPNKIVYGYEYTYSGTVSNQGSITVTVKYDREDVVVPLGAYSNCLKVTFRNFAAGETRITWHAAGVGAVKSEVHKPNNGGHYEVLTAVGAL